MGYVAIEIESLAVAWAIEKFHHFLYASYFILETDQKPLEAILSKSLNQTTPKTTNNSNKNFPKPLHCMLHTRCHKSTCQLLVQIRRSEGYNLVTQTSLVKLLTNYAQEVTV